jgi:hypothetical protein
MKTRLALVETTLAAEKGRGLTERISIGSVQPGNPASSARTSGSVSGGQSASTIVPSMPCAFAVVFIARSSSVLTANLEHISKAVLCQGTTSAVPKRIHMQRALAPEGLKTISAEDS